MSGETFWRGRTWAFPDGGAPALVTAEEFMLIVRDHLHVPVEWKELVTLTSAGAIPPKYLLYVRRAIPGGEGQAAPVVLPIYETAWAAVFVRRWRQGGFAIHIPVATTKIDYLRSHWGPRLTDARVALGLEQESPPIPITPIAHPPPPATGKTWHDIARAVNAEFCLPGHGVVPPDLAAEIDRASEQGVTVLGVAAPTPPAPRRRDIDKFWQHRPWIFAEEESPRFFALTEFIYVLREYFGVPVDRGQLLALGTLGIFPPQHILFVGRLAERNDKIVELAAPVYDLPAVGRFWKEWWARLALHVPVTTTVEELRAEWGPKLREARRALGIRSAGRAPERIVRMDHDHTLTGTPWRQIARTDERVQGMAEYDLMAQSSRYRQKERKRAQQALEVEGWLRRESHPALERRRSWLRERSAPEVERGRAALSEGKPFYPEDEDLITQILDFSKR